MEEDRISDKKEILTEVVGFDFRKLWTTFKDLTIIPGETAASYCDGMRSKYVSPITYFLLAFGLNFFAAKLSGALNYTFDHGRLLKVESKLDFATSSIITGYKIGKPNATQAEIDKITSLFGSGFEFMSSKEGMLLLILPLMVILQWLFFRKYRKSFFYNLYFILFVSAQVDLLTIPLMLLLFFPSLFWTSFILTTLISIGIYYYAAVSFYPKITTAEIVARNVGMVAAGIIPFMIWFVILLWSSIYIIHKFF